MTCVHGRAVVPELDDQHCRSELDLESRRLTLNVRVLIQLFTSARDEVPICPDTEGSPPAGARNYTVRYRGGNFERSDTNAILRQVPHAIETYWNDQLELIGITNTTTPRIRCGVSVELVRSFADRPHLQMHIIKDPEIESHEPWVRNPQGYRSRTFVVGGRARGEVPTTAFHDDMRLGWSSTRGFDSSRRFRTSDHGEQLIPSNVLAHEFGHYLGLYHACVAEGASDSEGGRCDPSEYCSGGTLESQLSIMARGTRVDPEHATPWAERLDRHHFMCKVPWYGVRL